MANNISIIGRLGADGEGKNVSGTALFEFRVAEDVGFGDRKVTNWWKVQLWGKQAEGRLVDFLTKGQQVAVFGEVTLREWQDKDGNKRLSPEIRANSVQLVGSKGDNAVPRESEPAPPKRQESKPAAGGGDFDDDIPFAPLGKQSRFSVLVM